MVLVDALVEQEKCKRSQAIGKIAAEHPDVHKAWLLDQQPGRAKTGTRPARPAPAPTRQQAGFMSLVEAYQTEHGCKKSEAMSVIAAENPGAHHDWLMAQQR